jgi:hypothetical protein
MESRLDVSSYMSRPANIRRVLGVRLPHRGRFLAMYSEGFFDLIAKSLARATAIKNRMKGLSTKRQYREHVGLKPVLSSYTSTSCSKR